MGHLAPDPVYAVRFSAPVRDGELQVRASGFVRPRSIRLRGPGMLQWVRVGDGPECVSAPVEFEVFSDRHGHPASPRVSTHDDDDALDDNTDGPAVDWPVFGGEHLLRLFLTAPLDESKLHVVLTVAAMDPWPRVSFRYADESAWNTATVLDYNTRRGELE